MTEEDITWYSLSYSPCLPDDQSQQLSAGTAGCSLGENVSGTEVGVEVVSANAAVGCRVSVSSARLR